MLVQPEARAMTDLGTGIVTRERSARARLIRASLWLRQLVREGKFGEALELSRERPWMGPFEPGSRVEEVPAQLADRLHRLLDRFADALTTTVPDRPLALLVCALHRALVDDIR